MSVKKISPVHVVSTLLVKFAAGACVARLQDQVNSNPSSSKPPSE